MEDGLPPDSGIRAARLFARPDASVLDPVIPVFFIGRNADRLWVVRNADARCGGLFFLRSSAMHYALRARLSFAPAVITLSDRVELDVVNSGNRYATRIARLKRRLARRARSAARTLGKLAAFAFKPLRIVHATVAQQRIHEAAIRLSNRR